MMPADKRPYCLYLYADVLGYRGLLEELGVDAFHERMRAVFAEVEAAVRDETGGDVGAGQYSSFAAFDTLMVFRHPIESALFRWETIDPFCYFASLICLRLFVQHDILIRGVIGATRDYRIDDRVITIAEIDRMYGLEKAQESATVLLDLQAPLRGPFPGTSPDEDPFLWHPLRFKNDAVPPGLAKPPMEPEGGQAALRLLNPRTVGHLRRVGLSFRAAVDRLAGKADAPGLREDVRTKLHNTLAFMRRDMEHYDTQDNELNQFIRETIGGPVWQPIP